MDRLSRFFGFGPLLLLAAAALLQLGCGQSLPKYFVIGDPLVLQLQPLSTEIKKVVWYHNRNLVVDLSPAGVEYFRSFKNRTSVNSKTGEIRISDTTEKDAGEFTVDINDTPHDQSFKAIAITKVPKPVVVVRTLSCSPTSGSCVLDCVGDPTGAAPVTYSWRWDSEPWGPEESTNTMTITSSHHRSRLEIYCRMKNPVSEEESEPLKNPLFQPSDSTTVTVVVVISIIILVILIGGAVWKKKDIKDFFDRLKRNPVPGEDRPN